MKIWRPYTQMLGAAPPEKVAAASGAWLRLADGRQIFDGISSWWLITHGHCHPDVQAAVSAQAALIDQVVFANFTHEPAEALVEELRNLLPPELDAVFFSDNGSTAVEVAMKMAYQYCRLTGALKKNKFLAFTHAFHGDTFGSMAVTADGAFTKAYSGLRLEVIRCGQGERSDDPVERWTEEFATLLADRHDEILAVVLEPMVQGAGGMIMWPVQAVRRIAELCRAHGVLLIFDEVMTGFGRTGKTFAFEHVGLTPDFVCLSKGLTGGTLPLALTLTTKEIYEAFLSDRQLNMFAHGHSFTANSISCAAARASLGLFRKTGALERVAAIEAAHARAIASLREWIPLRDARVLGCIGAIELRDADAYAGARSRQIAEACFKEGLFIRPLGSVLYLMPPYCATPDEVATAWDIIATATMSRA